MRRNRGCCSWYTVNNAPRDQGVQRYDLYARGVELATQQRVFEDAGFRIQRESPRRSFMVICNTGPHRAPYGNGRIRYDDIFMAPGSDLTMPLDN